MSLLPYFSRMTSPSRWAHLASLLSMTLTALAGNAQDIPGLPPPIPSGQKEEKKETKEEKENLAQERPEGKKLTLTVALSQCLANVRSVQAVVATRTATVGQFEALKHFVPMANLPQLFVGLQNVSNATNGASIFPDVTGGTPFFGNGLIHAELNRGNLFFPLDPSGQITALPIAEEGIRAKLLMEELVRRSQVELAAQSYFEAKRLRHAAITVRLAQAFAQQVQINVERKLKAGQAHDVELTAAKVDRNKSQVFVEEIERVSRLSQRRLGLTLHTSRLLVPQGGEVVPVRLDGPYFFELDAADEIDLNLVGDLPRCREDAIEMARRKRVEVRILVIGLNIARLVEKRDWWRLFGLGSLPLGLSFKNTTIANGGPATLGTIFGTLYEVPLIDIGLWSNVRRARLDTVRSQLDLEKVLLDVEEDAGNAWDRLSQAELEYQQKVREEGLANEQRERAERMVAQKQMIPLDILAADVGVSQAQTNRWTAWYNLQLARLDLLRATDLLLDYLRDAGIEAPPQPIVAEVKPSLWQRLTSPFHSHRSTRENAP